AAISSFARGLRREVWGQGVTINLFSPGHMNTNISNHLQERVPPWYGKSGALNIEDVAEKMVKAIKKKRNEVIVGRKNRILSHLIKFFPFFANNIIRKITA